MLSAKLDGNRKFAVVEIDAPKADASNVLIKVNKVGICGSDIHIWAAGDNFKGLVLGHEYTGRVVDPGPLKGTLKEGDRVTSIPLSPCMKCDYCRNGLENLCLANENSPGVHTQGTYAEYFAARADLVRKLPGNISDEEAALTEPAAVTLHAVNTVDVKKGDKVLITGAGIIGALSAVWARRYGASYIALSEINVNRAEKLLKLGIVDEVFNGTDTELIHKLMKATGGGFDKHIECSGSAAAINTGLATVKKGSTIGLVGVVFGQVPISSYATVMKAMRLQGMVGYSIKEFDTALEAIATGKIDVKPFISGTYALKDIQIAMESISDKETLDFKLLISC